MTSETEYEVLIRNHLTLRITELGDLEEQLRQASQDPSGPDLNVKEVMKRLSMDVQACEDHIEHHATGANPLTNDLMMVIAQTLRSVHEVMSAVVLYYATAPVRGK